jgi:hypothetical protein
MEMNDMETVRNIANQRYWDDCTVVTAAVILLDLSDTVLKMFCWWRLQWESRPTVDRHVSEFRLPPRKADENCNLLGSYAATGSRSAKFATEITYIVNGIFHS